MIETTIYAPGASAGQGKPKRDVRPARDVVRFLRHHVQGEPMSATCTGVDQTILASDPNRQGNCLSACVASFLSIPLERVPHFIELGIRDGGAEDRVVWWYLFLGFMAGHGYWPSELADPADAEPGEWTFVMGMSERGVCHQVLYRDGALHHDPHPSRAGLVDVREVLVFRPATFDHTPTDCAAREEQR